MKFEFFFLYARLPGMMWLQTKISSTSWTEQSAVDLSGPASQEIKLLFHDPVKYLRLARDASDLQI